MLYLTLSKSKCTVYTSTTSAKYHNMVDVQWLQPIIKRNFCRNCGFVTQVLTAAVIPSRIHVEPRVHMGKLTSDWSASIAIISSFWPQNRGLFVQLDNREKATPKSSKPAVSFASHAHSLPLRNCS